MERRKKAFLSAAMRRRSFFRCCIAVKNTKQLSGKSSIRETITQTYRISGFQRDLLPTNMGLMGLATLTALISGCMRRRTAAIHWYIYSDRNSAIYPRTIMRKNSVFSDILSPTAWWKQKKSGCIMREPAVIPAMKR